MDAYVNSLDDFIDLDCVDVYRGKSVKALYVRTILLANWFLTSDEIKKYILYLSNDVFDVEYRFRTLTSNIILKRKEFLEYLEKVYISQAYDAWIFFFYPAKNRLIPEIAEKLSKAGIIFRATWLLLDHLLDLDEDRENNILTGVRIAIDQMKQQDIVRLLFERLDSIFNNTISDIKNINYTINLANEYKRLKTELETKIETL